ncbi:hypothetical protein [uncultured Microbacterium sp.]|uniref:hypothetical protein n=1 Tax=uncultured Microbacterium sp. TaxID=191216 RepID=UPI0026335434|nr:hypothetical protein [uncultured Microbacterium sp.]
MSATIKREVTREAGEVRYVHSVCSECGYWYAFTWTVENAYTAGERHLINVHGFDARSASVARRKAESRHAEPAG